MSDTKPPNNVEDTMRKLARLIKKTMPKGYGFSLFIFKYATSAAERGELFYLSSAKHDDMLTVLKEFIAKHELH